MGAGTLPNWIGTWLAALPEGAIPEGFVNAAIQALRGIQAVTVRVDALVDALRAGGLPCTVDELQQRFAAFVRETVSGHEVRNTRLTLDGQG